MTRLKMFPEILASAIASTYFFIVGAWLAWCIGVTIGVSIAQGGLNVSLGNVALIGIWPIVVLPFLHPLSILLGFFVAVLVTVGLYTDDAKWRVIAAILIVMAGSYSGYLLFHG